MKKYWIVMGIAATAIALVYPSIMLYRFLLKKRTKQDSDPEHHVVKAFVPAYRGEHKHPHRRVNGRKDGTM